MAPENISKVGIELIKRFEGCHEVKSGGLVHSYRDPVGIWTIGYGHTKDVKADQVVSMETADAFLVADAEDAVAAVRRYVKVSLTQNQFDALVSFTFNLGAGNLRSSTLLRLLNAGQYNSVPEQLNRWNKGRVGGKLVVLNGLTRRRSAEGAMFMMDTPFAGDGGEAMTQKPRAGNPDVKELVKSRTLWGTALAGAGTVAAVAQEVATNLEEIGASIEILQAIAFGLTIIGIGFAAYARWDDYNKSVK
jgi:lysozyme